MLKKRELERKLADAGWWLDRHGGNHDIWTNGTIYEAIPRHPEINEILAIKIIRKSKNNPPNEEGK